MKSFYNLAEIMHFFIPFHCDSFKGNLKLVASEVPWIRQQPLSATYLLISLHSSLVFHLSFDNMIRFFPNFLHDKSQYRHDGFYTTGYETNSLWSSYTTKQKSVSKPPPRKCFNIIHTTQKITKLHSIKLLDKLYFVDKLNLELM